MMRIIVSQRSSDHHACVEGDPKNWECAPSAFVAVRHLIERFQLTEVEVVMNPPHQTDGVVVLWTREKAGEC